MFLRNNLTVFWDYGLSTAHESNQICSTEPMFSIKTGMFRPRKKVWALEVFIGIFVDIHKNTLISILKLMSSNLLRANYPFTYLNMQVFKNSKF